jgi:hypothetical protein
MGVMGTGVGDGGDADGAVGAGIDTGVGAEIGTGVGAGIGTSVGAGIGLGAGVAPPPHAQHISVELKSESS